MLIKFKKQKGVSLYLALVIMTVFLSMGAGLGVILIKQKESIRGMSSSVVSFYAADSGVERILYLDSIGTTIPFSAVVPLVGVDGGFKAQISNNCGLKKIVSHGSSGSYGTRTYRSIEVIYGEDNSGPHLNEHNGSCDEICKSLNCTCDSIGTTGSGSTGNHFYWDSSDPAAIPGGCRLIFGNCGLSMVPQPLSPCPGPEGSCKIVPCPNVLSPETQWTYCYCTSTSPTSP